MISQPALKKNVPWLKFSKVTNDLRFHCFHVFSLKYLEDELGFQKILRTDFLQMVKLPLETFRPCHLRPW